MKVMYSSFINESKKNKIFFTSDTHFSSERTLEFSKRLFDNVNDMDDEMIQKWNDVVGDDDTVYHLGDFGNYEVVKKLNGNIIMLCGNYEHKDIKDKYKDEKEFEKYLLDLGFSEVIFDKNYLLKLKHNDSKYEFNLIHEPENKSDDYFNLFGHIHQLQMVKKYGLNVGCDCHKFYPIDVDCVLFYKNAIAKHYDGNVFN